MWSTLYQLSFANDISPLFYSHYTGQSALAGIHNVLLPA